MAVMSTGPELIHAQLRIAGIKLTAGLRIRHETALITRLVKAAGIKPE